MGVWIETHFSVTEALCFQSHPVWVCGLKHKTVKNTYGAQIVTPCMGVWIETVCLLRINVTEFVTPCMGVWIET